MNRWRHVNAGAAAALLLIITGCAVAPAVEQSVQPTAAASSAPQTSAAETTPLPPTASPSPSAPSLAPSMAPPSTTAPDPTPATKPLASLTSGSLGIDELALVVADELRVRSSPGTSSDSTIRGEPLTRGREVFIVAGPVPANGYLWWQVQVLTGPGRFGWVAGAGGDGETWLAPASIACPTDPSVADLARIGGARSLVCYGRSDLQIRAFRQPFCGDGIAMGEGSPGWINGVFGGDALLDREVERGDENALEIYGRAHPSLIEAGTEYLGCGDKGTGWFDVTGHFDDSVSSDCRFSYYDPATDGSVGEEPALSIADCRQTFVYTEIRPASAP